MTRHRPRRVHGPAQARPTRQSGKRLARSHQDVSRCRGPRGRARPFGERCCLRGAGTPLNRLFWHEVSLLLKASPGAHPMTWLPVCLKAGHKLANVSLPLDREGQTLVTGDTPDLYQWERRQTRGIFLIHDSNWPLLHVSHLLSRPWPPNTLRVLSCLVTSVLTHCPVLGCGAGPGSRHACK